MAALNCKFQFLISPLLIKGADRGLGLQISPHSCCRRLYLALHLPIVNLHWLWGAWASSSAPCGFLKMHDTKVFGAKTGVCVTPSHPDARTETLAFSRGESSHTEPFSFTEWNFVTGAPFTPQPPQHRRRLHFIGFCRRENQCPRWRHCFSPHKHASGFLLAVKTNRSYPCWLRELNKSRRGRPLWQSESFLPAGSPKSSCGSFCSSLNTPTHWCLVYVVR